MTADMIDLLTDRMPGLIRKARSKSRSAAIRAKCFDCMATTSPQQIRECPVKRCPLWPYRLGRGFEDPGLPIPEPDPAKVKQGRRLARKAKR